MEANINCAEKSEASTTSEEEMEEGLKFFDSLSIDDEVVKSELLEENVAPATVDVLTLLKENYEPNIGLLTKENYKQLQRPFIVSIHTFKGREVILRNWLDLLAELSLIYSNIKFYIANVDEYQLFSSDCNRLCGISMAPSIYAVDTMERQFKYTGFFSNHLRELLTKQMKNHKPSESIKDFCENFLKGKLFVSEPLPVERAKNAAVKTAVGYNFQALVVDAKTDVLLIIYTDWCPFSKQLLPILDELALLLSDYAENLSIVKIKDELNYIPLKYSIFAYPSVRYIPRNDKEKLVPYNHGPRTIENLAKFIAEYSTFELKNFDRFVNNKNINS